MKALGTVPVGHPVDAAGAATCEWGKMIGIAGRGGPNRTQWSDGEEFELVTDKDALMVLIEPMDLVIAGTEYRLPSRENIYAFVRGGKIVDFQGRAAPR